MPAYDPQRDRGRPAPSSANPVDALLDGVTAAGADTPDPGAAAESVAVAAAPAVAEPEGDRPDSAPTVTPQPVDPSEDRALARIGVIGGAVAAAALITLVRQLRRRRS